MLGSASSSATRANGMNSAPPSSPDLHLQDPRRVVRDDLEGDGIEIGQGLAVLAHLPVVRVAHERACGCRAPSSRTRTGRCRSGARRSDLAFSASVAPGSASNSALGRIAVLKMASAGMMVGSGCLSFSTIVSGPRSRPNRSSAIRPFQMPFSGLRARSSDHLTSSAVMSEPSANLTPSRRVRVTSVPSSETAHSVARPGSRFLPSGRRADQRVVEVGEDPDVDIGIVQDRIEEQAVGVAAEGQVAAALDGEGVRAPAADAGPPRGLPSRASSLAVLPLRQALVSWVAL